MIFEPVPLEGAWLIRLEPIRDHRGFFLRAYSEDEFAAKGLNVRWPQTNHSYTAAAGTLRGMHYQMAPHAEMKLVRCLRGAIYDVIVDLRPASPTYRRWFGVELNSQDPSWLYVPQGFAHGFVTLTGDVEVEYKVSAPYAPQAERGFRYDDPYFAIRWPHAIELLSAKDASWLPFDPATGHPLEEAQR